MGAAGVDGGRPKFAVILPPDTVAGPATVSRPPNVPAWMDTIFVVTRTVVPRLISGADTVMSPRPDAEEEHRREEDDEHSAKRDPANLHGSWLACMPCRLSVEASRFE